MASEVRFPTLRARLESAGWRLKRISGSHHVFVKPGRLPISIPVHGNKVKAVYARKVQQILEEEKEA
jgi:predicted RNA binding protein YcfA (HicA-like mRNA interferase family)